MNISTAKRLGRWLAGQLGDMPGGFEGACRLPDAPMNAKRLTAIARGERPWPWAEGLVLLAQNDRLDLLSAAVAAAQGERGPGAFAAIAHQDVYDSADLARRIDEMEQDGRRDAWEIREVRDLANTNLINAVNVHQRAYALEPGEIEQGD